MAARSVSLVQLTAALVAARKALRLDAVSSLLLALPRQNRINKRFSTSYTNKLMKQTNNALKYLLAQYRAIFKNAYFKGLVPAMLVTAGLAAGQANAAAVTDIDTINTSADEIFEIDGEAADGNNQLQLNVSSGDSLDKDLNIIVGDKDHHIQTATSNTAGSTVLFNGNGHNITITDDDNTVGGFTFGGSSVTSKLQIKNLGTLTIDGAKVNLNVPDSNTNIANNQVGVDVGANNVIIQNGALVNLNNELDGSGNRANTILRGYNIEITGEDTIVNVGSTDLTGSNTTKNTKAVLGWQQFRDEQGGVDYSGSNITVDGATINLTGIQVEGSFGASSYHPGYTARVAGNSFIADNARIVVSGGASGGAMFEVHETTLNNSVLDIKDGVVLNLEMQDYSTNFKDKKEEKDANINYNGTATINGGLVKVDGALMVTRGGTLKIADDVVLTAVSDAADDTFDGAIHVSLNGTPTGNYKNTVLSTLELSSSTLNKFLNDKTEVIQDGTTTVADSLGQVNVGLGGRIHFTDTTQVEIAQFTFDNAAGAGHINVAGISDSSTGLQDTTAIEGGFTVDSVANALDGTRTIVASNMSIGRSLIADSTVTSTTDWEQVKSGNSSYAFRFEANDLTLGSERGTFLNQNNWNGFDSSESAIGAHELKAHRSITFIDGTSDVYTLQDDVVLDTTLGQSETILGSTTSATTGTLNGDDVTVDGGSIKIEGGAWTTTQGQAITLADGSLTVAAAHAGEEKKDGLDLAATIGGVATSLTVNGGAFVIDKATDASAEPTITVTGASGATALLDLRGTSVTWGSGSVTVAGASTRDSKTDILSDAGEGQLFITGAQFKNFITTDGATPSATKLTLGDDGVLFADGTISGDIDVGTFVTDAAAAGKVYFSGAGTFATTGALSITADTRRTDSDVLALGEGTIDAQSITLNNKGIAANNKGDLDKDIFTVSGGTLVVASGLSSPNSVVEFKSNGASGSILELDTDDNAQGGLINTNLRFSGANSGLYASQGQWAFAEGKDAYFAGGATFNVGASAEEYAILGDTVSLTLDNLNVTGTSRNTVAEGGSLTVNTMQAGDGSTFDVQGQFTINGRADIDGTSASTEIDEVKKADDTAGIDLAKATFNVNGPDAQLKLGNVATETLVKITAGELADKAKTTVDVNKALGDAVINLSNHGMLYLDFSSGTTITAQNAKDLKASLIDSMGNGILNVGSGSLDIKWDDETNLITSWDNVKDFANVEGVTSDKVMATLINKVAVGTVVTGGHYGAIQTDFAAPTALNIDGNLGLHQARDTDGDGAAYFVFSSDASGKQQAVGVSLATNSSLLLDGAGKIGAISGNLGSELVITQGQFSGANVGVTEVLGAIKDVGYVEVGNDTTVAGDITADELRVEAGNSLSNVFTDGAYNTVVTNADILGNASFSTQNLTLDARNGRALSYNDSWIMGQVEIGDTLKLLSNQTTDLVDTAGNAIHANELIIAGGTVKTVNTVLDSGSAILVGLDAQTRVDTDANDGINKTASYTGAFETQTLDLNGGALTNSR